jgi:cellulose synthase/poly-beta-1,6-N-acetylglucosamine synthase-like glycosyltransferase
MTVITILLIATGCVAASIALYLALLTAAALRYRPVPSPSEPRLKLAVLIPAHDEALLIARCVTSLVDQDYVRELYDVVVIADNCTDETATIARDAGADLVLVRDAPDARGKGRALRWAIDRLLSGEQAPDAIVVIDADSWVPRDFLSRLSAPVHHGAEAIQADYLLESNGTSGAALRAVAFLLVNRVRPAGRSVLGMSTFLVGNGMLFATGLLRRHPWEAFTSTEDIEYSLDLQTAGVRIAFAADAFVRSETAPNPKAAAVQQLRWEGGKLYLLRTRVPRLVRDAIRSGRPSLIVAAFDLATPPLGLLGGVITAGTGLSAAAWLAGASGATVVPWAVAVAGVTFYVLVGLAAGHAPRSAYRALLGAPRLLLTKPLSLVRVARFRPDSWVRTERAYDGSEPQP